MLTGEAVPERLITVHLVAGAHRTQRAQVTELEDEEEHLVRQVGQHRGSGYCLYYGFAISLTKGGLLLTRYGSAL
eukprot:scaffold3551_cov118-Isochrysis_galbana.AAC.5